jgi:hypothetical protein
MLNAETSLHAESGSLLDGKRFAFEAIQSTGGSKIDDYVGTALDLKMK